ncbi:hypothetical protein CISG_10394 [Coccidioides immitis RMSCC 3703]|uniref:Uncharacterized protein n=4 Tax=Coccidioides TaxID=5500 RepID=E9D8E2_COCPS|nr:conserved hypothetical protein [Coccidioides posadasii str. Silveira]KMM70705.1 hypothetical protein CPAG_07016 [Coccidioides posadasii RMSCC 3488]KMP05401.1 hypothetical protein CIRG_05082 [Coccidioides immitis RMSCC 2394]KMU75392.1 hypothetical protein CISG_10394 [Coccidioides immitis RMSCC 3703]
MSAHAGCAGSTFLIQTPPLPTLRSSFTAASDQVTDKPSYKTRGSMPNVGTYRHCSDEWATKSDDILAGSSRAKGDCITCADPTRTVVIRSIEDGKRGGRASLFSKMSTGEIYDKNAYGE